ncbi:MAG: hypothetical protein JPMHGGIA_01240 [Saprospiraceae bacterium]|jgi:hypothetical protein|nr:hypothetical protein [Saprospiraceae bacterium]
MISEMPHASPHHWLPRSSYRWVYICNSPHPCDVQEFYQLGIQSFPPKNKNAPVVSGGKATIILSGKCQV